MDCITFGGLGVKGGGLLSMGASGLILARHVHWCSQCGVVLFGGLEF